MIFRIVLILLLAFSTAYAQKATMTLDDQGITSPLRVNPADGTCSQSNIQDAIIEGSSTGNKTILLTREDRAGTSCMWAITSSLTIPSDYALMVPNGSMLTISAGITLTINGALYAEDHQIFTGSGTVIIDRRTPVRAIWYGAVCDDTTDVAVPLQRAIDTASGNTVQLLSGTCRIGATINLSDGVTIEGRGPDKTIIKPMPAANLVRLLLVQDTASRITLRGFTLDGNAALNPQDGQYGLVANKYDGLLVDTLTFQNLGNTPGDPSGGHILLRCLDPAESDPGFLVGGGCSNAIIRNSRFIDTGGIADVGVGFTTSPHLSVPSDQYSILVTDNDVVSNSFFGGFELAAIFLQGPGTIRNKIRNNNLRDTQGQYGIYLSEGATKNHVTNNVVEIVAKPGLSFSSAIAVRGSFSNSNLLRETADNLISNNIVEIADPQSSNDSGIIVRLDTRTIVSNNTVRVLGTLGNGIFYAGGVVDTRLLDNVVEAYICVIGARSNTLRDQTGWVFQGNRLSCDFRGIDLMFSDPTFKFDELVIRGNTISPWTFDEGTQGINLSGPGDKVIIATNILKDMATGIVAGGNDVIIKGNTMRDVTTPVVINASASSVVRAENTCVSAGGVASSC